MPDRVGSSRTANATWLWILVPLLLIAALTIHDLDEIAFNGDEISGVAREAGALRPGPTSVADVWQHASLNNQATGFPLLLSMWGRAVGWSEVAVRSLPFFCGLLTVAMVYRAGHDMESHRAGFIAAALLSTSLFLQTNMLHARTFPLVTFLATVTLYAWWRTVLAPGQPDWRSRAALFAGVTGLFYTHYLSVLLLPVLVLFQIFLVAISARWWLATVPIGLGVLAGSLQLPVFLEGVEGTLANEKLHQIALEAPELIAQFFEYSTNGLLSPSATLGNGLVVLLLLVPVGMTAHRLILNRDTRRFSESLGLLAFVCIALLLLHAAVNEVFRLVTERRMRYLISLWPLMALLAGTVFHRLARRHAGLVAALLALWLLHGINLAANFDSRYQLGFFEQTQVHLLYRELDRNISEQDGLILAADWNPRTEFYLQHYEIPYTVVTDNTAIPSTGVWQFHSRHPGIWMLFHPRELTRMEELASSLGRYPCRQIGKSFDFLLVYYTSPNENCPDSPVQFEYERGIELAWPDVLIQDGKLGTSALFRSEDANLLAHYSFAVHVIDRRSGQRVAQGDAGVGPGAFVPVRGDIDVSALPAGDYEVQVALYDWQTGERLNARDLATGEISDMHVLHRFRIG